MPSKITLPLHRFIKKVLKIFQAHGNAIAIPLPPPKSLRSLKQMDVEANIASKASCCYSKEVLDDLYDSAVQWTAGTFKIALSPLLS